MCRVKLPLTNHYLDPVNEMSRALWGRANVQFAAAYLFFKKNGITQSLLHQLKYRNKPEIGIEFGSKFGAQLCCNPFPCVADYLLPVPIHASKLKSRGYNQSKIICEGMQRELHIPVIENLVRIRSSETQTHKHRFERWLNVSEQFKLNDGHLLKGKRVILVDDVFTTGATVEACCRELEQIEGIEIGIATLAVALN